MSKALVHIPSRFNPDDDFWELNPQLKYYFPFSELYEQDKSKGKTESSKQMWCIVFLEEPDESVNTYARMRSEQRAIMLKETYYPDLDLDVLSKYRKAWIEECQSSIQRAIKNEIESMYQRSEMLRTTDYTLTTHEVINGKVIKITGTALELDKLRAATPKLMENYEMLEKQFLNKKHNVLVEGKRNLSKSEKGEV